jgi:hypothetical protein
MGERKRDVFSKKKRKKERKRDVEIVREPETWLGHNMRH